MTSNENQVATEQQLTKIIGPMHLLCVCVFVCVLYPFMVVSLWKQALKEMELSEVSLL